MVKVGKMVNLSKYRTLTNETVVLGEIGHDGPLGTMRYVLHKGTRTVWYVGDDGQIMQNVLDEGQYDVWAETGALAVYPSSADDWDEQRDWDNLIETGGWDYTPESDAYARYWDMWALFMLIRHYLDKVGETGPNGDKIRKMHKNYQRGLCTLLETMNAIADDLGF